MKTAIGLIFLIAILLLVRALLKLALEIGTQEQIEIIEKERGAVGRDSNSTSIKNNKNNNTQY